ncbi:MAG: hypothetical protein OS130_10150 [Thermodesulfobacteriota bacterium]|jgi:hypothetical protein|nr:MAG: hypothetical protein OS130_10150 [Thermodesulfobacteriota bacterium]
MYTRLYPDDYKTAWLEAERDFAVQCFSIPGCLILSQNNNISNEVNPLNQQKENEGTGLDKK